MNPNEERIESIARLIQTDQDAKALRLHMSQLLESPAFSSSRRSGQFLQYVVEKAVAQQTEALKERVIGMEVFHRSPDYDTGEDAIVRVTASDVRRRLAQHYSGVGRSSEFRISLPPGGYAPQVSRDMAVVPVPLDRSAEADASLPAATPVQESRSQPRTGNETAASEQQGGSTFTGRANRGLSARWLALAAVAALFACAASFLAGRHTAGVEPQPVAPAPWSLLFVPGKPLLVLMADPDLNEIQLLTHHFVTPADYAAGKLGCETLAPELQPVCVHNLEGDKSSTVDVAAVSRIAALAGRYGSSVETLESRSLRLPDLQTDRNIVLFGSRKADPWVDLLRDKLDFYVGQDDRSGLQAVYNTHPRPGEAAMYLPTAGPFGSGDTYTLVSLTHNLNGKGYALVIGGATHEGMDAATSFVLDPERLGRARRDCGITADDTPFQMLLKLKMMAGSPLQITSITCHQLAG